MLPVIITGGQTGVDQAGWRAAKAAGLKTFGWMPRGFLTETADGRSVESHPEFAGLYGAREDTSRSFPSRTRLNVTEANGVLILFDAPSNGVALTSRLADELYRPIMTVSRTIAGGNVSPRRVADWINRHAIRGLDVVMVAGNRESKAPGIGAWAEAYLRDVFAIVTRERR